MFEEEEEAAVGSWGQIRDRRTALLNIKFAQGVMEKTLRESQPKGSIVIGPHLAIFHPFKISKDC